jgi:hypothetical protein
MFAIDSQWQILLCFTPQKGTPYQVNSQAQLAESRIVVVCRERLNKQTPPYPVVLSLVL